MAKLPWMKFYPADYLLDTQLLTISARGVWMDIICHLWRSSTRGVMTLSRAQWSLVLRASDGDVVTVFDELKRNGICNIVTGVNGDVTVESRRITKEERARTGAVNRMRAYREKRNRDGVVTPEKLEARSQKLEARSQKKIKSSDFSSALRASESPSSDSSLLTSESEDAGGRVHKKAVPAVSKIGETWDFYSAAYHRRYGAMPVRNASVNGMLSHLVKKLGVDEAPLVAAFYVSHNDAFYVKKMHAVRYLLVDAEKLRTEWATGKTMTKLEADQAGKLDSDLAQIRRVEKMLGDMHPPAKDVTGYSEDVSDNPPS